MAIASWLHVSKLHFASALKRMSRRRAKRRPIRSRPCLEPLEQRMLLDGASGVVGNLTILGGLGANGVVMPVPGSGGHGDLAPGLSYATNPQIFAIGAATDQDLPGAQFRLFAINSQGDDTRLALLAAMGILADGAGFGSGSQPNAPWRPAAYNLGLANHQFNYPSQTDMGFSAVSPWHRHTAYQQPNANPPDQPEQEANPESILVHKTDADDKDQQGRQLVEHLDDEQPAPPLRCGDAALEEALFVDNPYLRDVARRLHLQMHSAFWAENETDSGDGGIVDSLWLSALGPVPLASLVPNTGGEEALVVGDEVGVGAAE